MSEKNEKQKPKTDKPKAEKKPKKEGSKPRKQTSWKMRNIDRLLKATKSVGLLVASIVSAKPPNVSEAFAGGAHANLVSLMSAVLALPDDWKPAKGTTKVGTSKKIGVGSVVQVRTDLDRTELKLYKHIAAELFTGATVLEGDGRYWIVKCADGATRMLIKTHAALVAPVVADAAKAA